jgi:hypothetical protein
VSPDGFIVDDFALDVRRRMIRVLNAPSPAATSSLAIARHVAVQAENVFDL